MELATTLTILAIAFIVTVILAPIGIPLLRRLKFGQSIREEGPKSHMKKAGTPTMGGIDFFIGHHYDDSRCRQLFRFIHDANHCLVTCVSRVWYYWLFR